MTQKFSIKDIRRIETEIDNEIRFIERRRFTSSNVGSSAEAAKLGAQAANELQAKGYELIAMRFQIRGLVAKFNEEQGINAQTAKIGELNQMMTFLEEQVIGFQQVRSDVDYHTRATSYIPGVNDAFVDEKRAEQRALKRQIQRLTDSCNGKNANARLELDEELVAKFVKYGFIDK